MAHLRVLLGRYRGDSALVAYVDHIRDLNADFARMWAEHPATQVRSRAYSLHHPIVGELILHGAAASSPTCADSVCQNSRVRSPVVDVAVGSDTGKRYSANFDVTYLRRQPLLAVLADGMGDGPGSAAAGRTAVDVFVDYVTRAPEPGPDMLRDAVAAAHARVSRIGNELRTLAGCTLTAMVAAPQGCWLVQIGDSRVYRLRDGLLELLTTDHTMAWLGAVHGWYPFDSAQAASARYQLTRYIGHGGAPEPDVLSVTMRPGDRYLLCTDGVSEQVDYGDLHTFLGRDAHPQSVVSDLLAASDAAGGSDNATAIVIRVD
ncbi:protein phosphatase 2C domain-containing protein [Nocardia sp. NPDC050710]|uniref:protein phosphatase 2C domain-containing protein n=1 Tax=Nocardia sp. NPDC050710 TaxID=3157220 RepID=UPI0033FE4B5C